MKVKAVNAHSAERPLEPMDITRREPEPHGVEVEVAYYGVYHSSIHQVRSKWAGTVYPRVSGHKIVGHVIVVGDQVEKYAPGDPVNIGCIVDGYKHCEEYENGLEDYCDHTTEAYNSSTPDEPDRTLGDYSQQVVVHERYVLRIHHPQGQLAAVAPSLCAGVITCSSLRHWPAGPGKKVGMVGIGGLGHIGIKLAHAMETHVAAFTTSESKREAAKTLGADEVVNSRNTDEMMTHMKNSDFILNIVTAPHNLDDFTTLLKRDGTITLIGAPMTPYESPEVFNLIMKHRVIASSMIDGIPKTQEMLDFCAEHGIVADIEMTQADQIDKTYERILRGDVKYRFVVDNHALTD